jgi:acetyl esterase
MLVVTARAERGIRMVNPEQFGPNLFALEAIAPETRAGNARIAEATRNSPPRWEIPLEVEREAASHGAGILPRAERLESAVNRNIPGPAGEIPIRILMPHDGPIHGVYLHFHGGGFCLGSADGQDPMLYSIANNARVAAISVEYRLAPEHPYPAGLDDAEAAVWWLVNNAQREFGVEKFVIGGESAGATLSAASALRLRDRRSYTELSGLNLSQGAYEFSSLLPSMRKATDTLIITRQTLGVHLNRYAPEELRDKADISPLRAELNDMPPALFSVGTLDPTLDDSMFMYMRWIAACNPAELAIYPGGIHGFTFLPTALGREACARIERFIANSCSPAKD